MTHSSFLSVKLKAAGLMLSVFFFAVSFAPTLHAQSIENIEQNVTEFTLDNGLHFIIIERDVAPVASFVTHVGVGSVNEQIGQTGLSHVFEHMAFKGSTTIGTTNWEEEKVIIDQMDDAYLAWLKESRSSSPDEEKLSELWDRFEKLQEKAGEFVVNNEFSQIVEREGASGLNAFVSADETAFFYSLPENKAELWFALEADRFMNPVMREYYIEKDVIMEERRDRVDNSPFGRLIEELISTAYSAFPYKHHPIGWPSDIEAVTIQDALDFYEKHYVPANMTISIAGDVDPDRMKTYAERYFGDMPSAESPPKVMTIEPEQRGERRFVMEEDGQPVLMIGYHSVDMNHPDAVAIDLLSGVLFEGRTSRLYRRMVTEEQKALQIGGLNGFPGSLYPGLFLIYAVPNQGVELAEIEEAVYEELDRIREGDISEREIERVRTNARASAIRGLASNQGMALNFAQAHAKRGTWQSIFTDLDEMEKVTPEDLQRVVDTYFVKQMRTVGTIQTRDSETASR
ncbi:M16 family metallopeptidase [Natronogracilivirga saccharolytica]|nr:pitrilysin family protein [Natronogracilivirga saccharolytica]